jgi:Ca-activated chloride channel family protein
MSFIWPLMLYSLLLVPVLIGLYVHTWRRRQQQSADLGAFGSLSSRNAALARRRHLAPLCFLLGAALLLLSLSRPEMVVALPRIEGTVILAFDVSNSMLADDLEPTRIEAAKAAARTFVENQPSTVQVGIVAFSNGGLIVQPPTNEAGELLATIDRLTIQGATSLGQGIFTSLNAIAGEALAIDAQALEENPDAIQIGPFSSAVIMLLSDGENTGEPDPLTVAQIAAEAGVRIYPIGIGSQEGAVLEIDGFNIVTALDETALQEIAALTNGAYFRAEDSEALQSIYENVDLQLATRAEKMEITSILAGFSLLLFLVGGGLSLLWFGRIP